MVIEELRASDHPIRLGDAGRRPLHEADEPVALGPHPRHHPHAIDLNPSDVHAKAVGLLRAMRGVGGGDQQLAGHAAYAGAGGAEALGFDQQHALGHGAGGAVGGHSCGAGAEDRDVDGEHGRRGRRGRRRGFGVHGELLCSPSLHGPCHTHAIG